MISKSALFISCVATVTALKCKDNNEALLQVKYNITQDEWNRTRPTGSGDPFLELPGNYITYDSFEDLVDFEVCLPRNNCTEVVVAGLPIDTYELSFDGKPADIEVEIPFGDKNSVTSTEVGTCIKPDCKDTEALVDFQYWNGFFPQHAYRVEDQNGDIIIDAPLCHYNSRLTRKRACVPRDNSCYSFLIGGHYQLNPIDYADSPLYNLFYDGKLVRRSDSWLFDSAQFGDACQPRCNQANESLVEFLSYDEDGIFFSEEYEYEWGLKLVTENSVSPSRSGGVAPIGPDKSPLYHKTMCVPKDSCSSFHISAPQNARQLTYSLAMGDTTYRKLTWFPGMSSANNLFNQTTNMGSCSVGGLCDKQSQDLFDLELQTPAEYKLQDGRFSPMIEVYYDGIAWYFDYTDVDKSDPHFKRDLLSLQYNNIGYDLDSSYRTIECVPKGDCDFAVNITADSAVETYALKKNGVQLDDSQELSNIHSKILIMTPFGQNCFPAKSRTLSAGAIAGIVIGCLVVLSVLIGGIVVCLNRRKERQNQRDEEDPLSENLLQR